MSRASRQAYPVILNLNMERAATAVKGEDRLAVGVDDGVRDEFGN
jgi:hypothetical protein